MNEHARVCAVCGDESATPASSATATYDQRNGRLMMPYACAKGHRFVASIRTQEFSPTG